ncbi:alpha-amylase [Alkalicoccobacillus porphyridii]|uniref:Alpha-amylase n=2 Tax=Alkalicoccobacillus porphyridii TaxID=2597270 RepID=A0A553ZX88_9BACI|nr:alpha-amylase [Alkalicoccobacillus porphyridii]
MLILTMVACQSRDQIVNENVDAGDSVEEVESVEGVEDEMKSEVLSNALVPEWSKDSVIYEVNFRHYTKEGTFESFKEHLPRLQELGVDILWFMPIHPISEENRLGTLGSYYAVKDYKEVNPEFGTMDDFRDLVETAQDMGFYVILDWVANHTGWDHSWIHENPNWYQQNSEGEIINPQEFNWTDVAQLNFENTEMRQEMKDAMLFWVEEVGVDGFRADYANGVPLDFWEDISAELNEIKEVFMLAEDDKIMELLNEAFLVNWGWGFYHLMNDIANEKRGVTAIQSYTQWVDKTYPKGSYPMNFMTNHDENSWNGTIEEKFGDASEAMAALYFTIPGIPLIYSGQEAGDKKGLEFFDKDEIDWSDLSLQHFYADLIQLKKNNEALWNGSAGGEITFFNTSHNKLLAFKREKEDNQVIVIMNLSSEEIEATIEFGFEGNFQLFQTNTSETLGIEGTYQLSPWEYRILSNE